MDYLGADLQNIKNKSRKPRKISSTAYGLNLLGTKEEDDLGRFFKSSQWSADSNQEDDIEIDEEINS